MRQVLSARRTRRYARLTGIPIERMLARGGSNHWILFRTVHDRHGAVNAATLEIAWGDWDEHWSSCRDDHPGGHPLTGSEYQGAHP